MAEPVSFYNLGGEPHCCKGPCKHKDCKFLRDQIGKKCPYCERIMDNRNSYTILEGDRLAHWVCAMRKQFPDDF